MKTIENHAFFIVFFLRCFRFLPEGILLNSVMGRQEWPEALKLLRCEQVEGFPNAKSYSILMSGCDWRCAIQLLSSGSANEFSYSSAMSACDKAGQVAVGA